MPELPLEIWKERITNELSNLKRLNVIEEDSIEWREDDVLMKLCLPAIGFALKSEEDPIELTPIKTHQIFLKIRRSFPYPGGIDFSWQSEIFHPNIHPVKLPTSKEPGTGYICLNVLKQWSRLSDLQTSIKALRKLVENPNPDDPLKYDICLKSADFFKKNSMDLLRARYKIEKIKEDKSDDDIQVLDE